MAKFSQDGIFRIIQVSDLHFWIGIDGISLCGSIRESDLPCDSWNSTAFIRRVIEKENPKLVLYSGDSIDENTIDAKFSLREAFKPAFEKEIPWAAVLGNHDHNNGMLPMSKEETIKYIMSLPLSLTEIGPSDIYGWGNFKLQVFEDDEVKWNIFMIHSNDYSKENYPHVNSFYDWIHQSQIQWYQQEVDEGVPSFAMFHIPIPEQELMIIEGVNITGDKFEEVSASKINSGVYASFLECGDVKSVFTGHNHINDYCGNYNEISLCYCGGSGFGTYGLIGWPRRVRVIQIEDFGNRLVTWKILNDEDLTCKDYEILWERDLNQYSGC